MKLYIIVQRGTEYNDEYDIPQEGGEPVAAFKSRANAEASLAKYEVEARKGKDIDRDCDDTMAYVAEVEVEDMDVVSYSNKLQAAKEAKAQATKLAKAALTESVEKIFNSIPSLVSFSWTQYTPHFNDGDECVFNVHADYPNLQFTGMDERRDAWDIKYDSVTRQPGPGRCDLYNQSDGHDKVYSLSIDKVLGGFMVNAAYGRRGSTMQFVSKTDKPVSEKEAQAVFDKIKQEKLSGGYSETMEYPVDDAMSAIEEALSAIDEDDMKEIFGDHVEVVATREGFTVEEYDHD